MDKLCSMTTVSLNADFRDSWVVFYRIILLAQYMQRGTLTFLSNI